MPLKRLGAMSRLLGVQLICSSDSERKISFSKLRYRELNQERTSEHSRTLFKTGMVRSESCNHPKKRSDSLPMPTNAEKARMQAIKESGCILCLIVCGKTQAPDVHHLTSAGRRRGHQFTIGACAFHHRGHLNGQSKQAMMTLLGPSHAWGSKGFAEFFGSDDSLLKIQNLILRHFSESPWTDYEVPYLVRREVMHLWAER